MSRFCLALMSNAVFFSSCAKGIENRSIEISIRIIAASPEFLNYSMNFDGNDFAVDDPESHGPRALQLGERDDEMGRFRVVGALDVGFRRFCGSVGMGVKDGEKLFSTLAEGSQKRDQL